MIVVPALVGRAALRQPRAIPEACPRGAAERQRRDFKPVQRAAHWHIGIVSPFGPVNAGELCSCSDDPGLHWDREASVIHIFGETRRHFVDDAMKKLRIVAIHYGSERSTRNHDPHHRFRRCKSNDTRRQADHNIVAPGASDQCAKLISIRKYEWRPPRCRRLFTHAPL